MDPELNYTTNVSKYSFGFFPMTFMRVLHIPGNKTNRKGNVRMGMGKIQEDTNKMTIQSNIYFGRSACERKIDSKLKGRRGWFTIFHVKATKKVTCILGLRKGNSFLRLQGSETKKIMQVS